MAFQIYSQFTKKLELKAGAAYVGDQSNEHTKISASGVEIKDGATVLSTFDANGHHNDIQPSFLIILDAAKLNVTGDGTIYTVEFNTEIFDKSSDFNTGTYTFTAPITGRYLFSIQVHMYGLTSGMTIGYLKLVTSNRTYKKITSYQDFGADYGAVGFTVLADMDTDDTAYVTIYYDGGAKVADVAYLESVTYFSGELLG